MKILTAQEAVALIPDGATVAATGFGIIQHPEHLTAALEERFLQTGSPHDLTYVHSAGQGNLQGGGADHLAHEGLLKRDIGGHFRMSPRLGQMILDDRVEAYNWPQGVIALLYREIAAKRPGLLTHAGLGTFVDPRLQGGKMTPRTTEELVEVVQAAGREWLLYPAFPIHVGLLRMTAADPHGNCTHRREACIMEALALALAAHNSGGMVIAQVAELLDEPLAPHEVDVPGLFVDVVVVAPPEHHWHSGDCEWNPAFLGAVDVDVPLPVGRGRAAGAGVGRRSDGANGVPPPAPSLKGGGNGDPPPGPLRRSRTSAPGEGEHGNDNDPGVPLLPLDERKVIARRAAMELFDGATVNLGIGMPEGVASVAYEEGIFGRLHLTVESGTIGGVPAGGQSFGASTLPLALISHVDMFDFYSGGGLDLTFLGLAEFDRAGNVNVSRFGKIIAGCGGFIEISQNAHKIVFCGTLTASGLQTEVTDAGLRIVQEGKLTKAREQIQQITFSAAEALRRGTPVLYVTDRCVFELHPEGVTLIEIAPGVDLEQDILAQMEFAPMIASELRTMDARLFREAPMGHAVGGAGY
ncbi:MAG: acyl CoA:acetate/3-ketoacid CoA transferase [Armatimonadetes bacterium]|nr:acyl CoA:acetate/3-ketoacid CoA transferase [Armatimonadota bacterium]